MWKVLIIDDEPAARRSIARLIDDYQDYLQLTGEAANGEEAIRLINELKPELIFLDIQLQDMTGFEILDRIFHQPNIIFTTAYDQYAIKAFEALTVDYLLKPIREERFAKSIEKLKLFGKANANFDKAALRDFMQSITQKKIPTAFPVKIGDKIILLAFSDISHLEADDKYVNIFTLEGNKYLSDIPLNKMSERLPSEFIRIQKSYIINKSKIREMHKHFNGRFVFNMNDKLKTRITSGLTYYDSIKTEFGL